MDVEDDERVTERITFTARIETYRFLEMAFPDATTASEAARMAVNELRVHRAGMHEDSGAFGSREDLVGRFTPRRASEQSEESQDS